MQKNDPLAELLEDGVIDAVHARLMSGKEATVFVVERRGHLGAAKVYKSRQDRTFKKVASYIEGRNQTRNSRDRRAMAKKSGYGRELMEEGWQDMEFRALRRAYDAGVLVPEPFFVFPNVLLMELVIDNQGAPASRLADFPYTPEQANLLHSEVFTQVKTLLAAGLIHGDLSAYNVLMAARGATVIDLPQVIDAATNTNAREILRRDLRNITEHLARFDARLQRFADCGEVLFEHYKRGTLDMAVAPEEGVSQQWRSSGRRGRDAERGRAGREKGPRPDPRPPQPAAASQVHHARGPNGGGPRPPNLARPPNGAGGSPAPALRPPHQTPPQGQRRMRARGPHVGDADQGAARARGPHVGDADQGAARARGPHVGDADQGAARAQASQQARPHRTDEPQARSRTVNGARQARPPHHDDPQPRPPRREEAQQARPPQRDARQVGGGGSDRSQAPVSRRPDERRGPAPLVEHIRPRTPVEEQPRSSEPLPRDPNTRVRSRRRPGP